MTSDQVLNELNRFRAEHFDLEPLEEMPKGKPRICHDCPIARSLPSDWSVAGHFAVGPLETDTHLLPEAVANFVKAFDQGAYPELIEP